MKTSQAGTLQVPAGANAKDGSEANQIVVDESWPRLQIRDGEGRSATLYLAPSRENDPRFELPPIPPAGIFDARFGSDRFVENLARERHDILINAARYPMQLTAHNLTGGKLILKDGVMNGGLLNEKLEEGKTLAISAPLSRLVLVHEKNAARIALK